MDYLDIMVGEARLPEQLREGAHADHTFVSRTGDVVDFYWLVSKAVADPFDDWQDGAGGEVVAHVAMPRALFEQLPGIVEGVLDAWDWTRRD